VSARDLLKIGYSGAIARRLVNKEKARLDALTARAMRSFAQRYTFV
jgi:hypothetical protein